MRATAPHFRSGPSYCGAYFQGEIYHEPGTRYAVINRVMHGCNRRGKERRIVRGKRQALGDKKCEKHEHTRTYPYLYTRTHRRLHPACRFPASCMQKISSRKQGDPKTELCFCPNLSRTRLFKLIPQQQQHHQLLLRRAKAVRRRR